jgi:hypothetical protein
MQAAGAARHLAYKAAAMIMHGTTQKHTHTHTHAPMVCMVTSITPLRKVKRTIKKFKKSPDKEPLKKASVVLNQWHGQIVWFSLVP